MNAKPARRRYRIAIMGVLLILIAVIAANRRVLTWMPHYLAAQRIAADRIDDARGWIDFAEKIGGENAGSSFQRSRLARHEGRLDVANDQLDRAEAQGLADDRVARERILIRAQAGDVRDAQTILPILLQGSPRDAPEICEAFALGFAKTHWSMEMAVGLLNAWIVDYPADPRPHVLLSKLSLEVMDVDNARQELERALEIDPAHGRAALTLGELTLKQQRLDEALKLFEVAASSEPTRQRALVWQAKCLRIAGRTAEAQAMLDRAFLDSRDLIEADIEQAQLEIETGDVSAAVERLGDVLDREPHRHEVRRALSTALRLSGQHDASIKQLTKANAASSALVRARHLMRDVARDPDNVKLRAEVGRILFEFGDPAEAREWLNSVLMFDPRHQPALRMLAELDQASRR